MSMQVPPGYALPFIKNGSGGIQLPFTHAAPLPLDSVTPLGAAPEGEGAPSTQPAPGEIGWIDLSQAQAQGGWQPPDMGSGIGLLTSAVQQQSSEVPPAASSSSTPLVDPVDPPAARAPPDNEPESEAVSTEVA